MNETICPNCSSVMERGYYKEPVCNCLGSWEDLKTINKKISLTNKFNYEIIILSGSLDKINYLLQTLQIKRNHIYEARLLSDSNKLIQVYKDHHLGECIFIKNVDGKHSFGSLSRDYKMMNINIEKIADKDIFKIILKESPITD